MKLQKEVYTKTNRTYRNKSTIIAIYSNGTIYHKNNYTHRADGPAIKTFRTKNEIKYIWNLEWHYENENLTENEYWNK